MAKQTFSVGQVLTAAQMTSLQQTAMLGGSATAKTASYTLVAADAGTVVSVNSTSATTITVNTGLFSAGDTVTIQNWGSGAVTITAGTATVNTAGSLIVPQYDGGVLYFTSASAAIYFDFVQAGAVSPLTTKGDLYGFGSSDARIPIGTNGHVLTADSTQTLGLKWAAPGGGSFVKIASGSFSAVAGVNIDSIFSTTYKNYFMILSKLGSADSPFNQDLLLQYRYSGTTDTTANYYGSNYNQERSNAATTNGWTAATSNRLMPDVGGGGSMVGIYFSGVGNTSESAKMYANYFGSANQDLGMSSGLLTSSQTFTGIRLSCSSNITGEYAVYGLEN